MIFLTSLIIVCGIQTQHHGAVIFCLRLALNIEHGKSNDLYLAAFCSINSLDGAVHSTFLPLNSFICFASSAIISDLPAAVGNFKTQDFFSLANKCHRFSYRFFLIWSEPFEHSNPTFHHVQNVQNGNIKGFLGVKTFALI